MVEHTFRCSTDLPSRLPKNCRVLSAHGPGRNIELDALPISRKLVTKIPPRLRDLIDIAAYVFTADRITRRGGKVGQGMGKEWRRNLKFTIAVRDPAHWAQPELVLTLRELLGFMSEDAYDFEFVKLEQEPELEHYLQLHDDPVSSGATAPVVLFSGGLDSLAGALEELGSAGKRVALVTHHSSKLMTSYQNDLVDELSQEFPHRVLYLPVRKNLTNGLQPVESSQRTRTFFFSAIAGAVAAILDAPGIRFYENGIMSLNLPISAQVVGTAATRSTHPRTLAEMALFLKAAIGHSCAVDNPFVFKTKAEVLKVIERRGRLDLIEKTMSCTEVRNRVRGCSHCGGCIQCLHRRFGILAAELGKHDDGKKYVLDLFESSREGDARTMAVDLVRSARSYVSVSDISFFQKYAGEISRIRGAISPGPDEQIVRNMIDLHRRHGEQITQVIENGLAQYKDALSKGLMAPGSLLTFVVGEQRGSPDRHPPTPATDERAGSELLLVIDTARNTYSVNALPAIEGKASVALLVLLAKQHRKDRTAERKPSDFLYVSTGELTAALDIDDHALRRRVERIRDKISGALAKAGAVSTDREIVIQSRSWDGYRLNPAVRLIAPN
jgi:7-cyano-7-deazaguanine synthase in queuosine biosynthesis